jgi:putative membrane protein
MNNDNNHTTLSKIVSDLANERTILAYVRTFLALLATGVAFQEIFDKPLLMLIGQFLMGLSVIVLFVGFISFTKVKKTIKKQQESVPAQFLD